MTAWWMYNLYIYIITINYEWTYRLYVTCILCLTNIWPFLFLLFFIYLFLKYILFSTIIIIIISRGQFFMSRHFSVSWNLFLSDLMILMFLTRQKSLNIFVPPGSAVRALVLKQQLHCNELLLLLCTYSRQTAVCPQWRLQTVDPTETPVHNQTVCSGPALSLVSDRVIRSSVICTAHCGFTFPVKMWMNIWHKHIKLQLQSKGKVLLEEEFCWSDPLPCQDTSGSLLIIKYSQQDFCAIIYSFTSFTFNT